MIMATNTYQEDGTVIDIAEAPYTVTAGQALKVGMIVGIALGDATISTPVTVKRTGVFLVAKTSAQAWAQGQGVYWNDGSRVFTTSGTGGIYVGFAAVAADNPSSTGYVCLTGSVTANQSDGSS